MPPGAKPPLEELEPHEILEQHIPNAPPITQLVMKRAIEEHAKLKRLYENLMEERTKDLLEKERFRGLAAVVDAINALTEAVRPPPVNQRAAVSEFYVQRARETLGTDGEVAAEPQPASVAPAIAAEPEEPTRPEEPTTHPEGTNGSSRSVR